MEKEVLEFIGLTEKEAKVYLTLLETGSTTAGMIAKKIKFHRSTTYEMIRRLLEMGMVNYVIKGGKRYFEATDPEKFLDSMKEKEQRLREILPRLKKKKDLSKNKQEAHVYEGKKGVKTVYEDAIKTLNKGEDYLVFGASEEAMSFRNFFRNYEKRRANKGIPLKIIFSENSKKFIDDYKKIPNTSIKTIPKEYMTPAEVNIFGDKTAIIVHGNKPSAFVIENENVADSFRKYFEVFWNQDIKVHKGSKQVFELFEREMLKMRNGEEYFVLGANYGYEKISGMKEWFIEYHKKRLERGVKVKLLFDPKRRKDIISEISKAGDENFKLSKIKFMPENLENPVQINIYKNKSIIFIWEKEPAAFEIENKNITKGFLNYFNTLWERDTYTLKGHGGIVDLCDEVLKTGKDMYLIGANGILMKNNPDFFNEFEERRMNAGIKRYHLAIEKTRKTSFGKLQNLNVRYLPEEFSSPMVIWIFSDYVAQVLWDDQIVFMTKNLKVANDYRKYFHFLWKNAKK